MLGFWTLLMSVILRPGLFPAFQEDVRPDVGYVPTPQPVVEAMLEMAEPRQGELLYDLGCGDGRIVVTAARRYGIQGIGVDIDPELIERSRENARAAGVEDLARFEVGNIFETDLRRADIVTLYLLTWINVSLRPRLLEQLHPGARIVAHQFGMDEWPHDRLRHIEFEGARHSLLLWIVPANFSGTWRLTAQGLPPDAELVFEQLFQHANGILTHGEERIPLLDVSLRGPELSFSINEEFGGDTAVRRFQGRIQGHRLEGRLFTESGSGEKVSEWTAERNPATMRAIDPSVRGVGDGRFNLRRRTRVRTASDSQPPSISSGKH